LPSHCSPRLLPLNQVPYGVGTPPFSTRCKRPVQLSNRSNGDIQKRGALATKL
ncbi:hypothetical protein FRC10_007472, partial [Ceratobasidium sp. 414]